MAEPKLNPVAKAALDQAKKELEAEFEAKKAELEEAASRRPWTVIAWSAIAGAVLGSAVTHFLF